MNKGLLNLVIRAVDNATPTIGKIGKSFGGLKKSAAAVGSALKTAALGTIGVATAAAGFVAKATMDAAAEEKQIARLNGVLKTRGMLTADNTKAIEAQTKKLENLAFSDDAVRESLITATSFTKKFSDAVKIQNVAADVAAAKGISLEEATSLVGKAYQGNTKGLKQLGVQTKKGAKGTDVLTAITKKYNGAAAAAANTVSGKASIAQIKFNNIMEDFGANFLPIASDGLSFLNDSVLPAFSSALNTVLPFIKDVAKNITDAFGPIIQDNITNFTKPGGVIDSVGKSLGPLFQGIVDDAGKVIAKLTGPDGFLTSIGDLVGALWNDGKGPLAIAVSGIAGAFQVVLNTIGLIMDAIKLLIDIVTTALGLLDKLGQPSTNAALNGRMTVPTVGAYGGGIPVAPASITVKVGDKAVDTIVQDSLGRTLTSYNRP